MTPCSPGTHTDPRLPPRDGTGCRLGGKAEELGRLSPTGRSCHLTPSKGDEGAAFPPCFHLPPHPPCTHPSREQARGAGGLIAALRGALLPSLPSCLSLGEGLAGCSVRILPPFLLLNDLIPFYIKPSVSPGTPQPGTATVSPAGSQQCQGVLCRAALRQAATKQSGELSVPGAMPSQEGWEGTHHTHPTFLTVPRKEP